MSNPHPVITPSRIRVQTDGGGIRAVNDRGHEIRYAVSPSAPGANPMELLAASLGMCTAINLRRELGAAAAGGVISPFEVVVECVKAKDAPSHIERLVMTLRLPDGIAAEGLANLVQRAEAACTIANTLRASAAIVTGIAPAPPAT